MASPANEFPGIRSRSPFWPASAFLSFLLFAGPSAFAQDVAPKGSGCEDLEGIERRYKQEYLEQNPLRDNYKVDYALCLLLKGETEKGLTLLQEAKEQNNNVYAAFLIAETLVFGDDFNSWQENRLKEAVEAYQDVLSLIDLADYEYPNFKHPVAERRYNMEIKSHSFIPMLYFYMYGYASYGKHNQNLLSSPSYAGTRDLETYPQYNPHVIDNLNKAIGFAGDPPASCLSLHKKDYFSDWHFENSRELCAYIKDQAHKLLPLELERETIVDQDHCRDILKCPEYDDATGKIRAIREESYTELGRIFGKFETGP